MCSCFPITHVAIFALSKVNQVTWLQDCVRSAKWNDKAWEWEAWCSWKTPTGVEKKRDNLMVFEWRFIVMLIISKDKSTKKMVGLSDICDSKQFILPCDGAHFHVDPSNAMPYSITLDQCLKCVWYHDLPWAFQALVTTSAFETSEGYPLHHWKKIQHIVIEQLSYIKFHL